MTPLTPRLMQPLLQHAVLLALCCCADDVTMMMLDRKQMLQLVRKEQCAQNTGCC